MKIAIVEDMPQDARCLQEYLEQYRQEHQAALQVSVFPSSVEFLERYAGQYDLLFLDVEMPGSNGLETAHEIRKKDPSVAIVFVTNMAQYAIRGYEVDAMDYLLKPLSKEKLNLRLGKVFQRLQRDKERFLLLPEDGRKVRVPVSEILYIEVFNHDLHLHTASRTFVMRSTLQEMEQQLDGCHFSRCGQSYLVNLKNVSGVQKDTVLVGGRQLRLSRTRKKQFLQEFSDYLGVGL